MKMKRLWVFALMPLALGAASNSPSVETAYTGGRWFDGSRFVSRTMIVRNGRFTAAQRVRPGSRVVDLAGGYVVPPFCEGHNHDIGTGKPEQLNRHYLNAGVFYVQILNNDPNEAHAERAFWNRPTTVDVTFAHGGITSTGGHPVEVLEQIRKRGGYGQGAIIADRAYYEVDTIAELERKWPMLRAERPDVVKLFLQFSEDYERRRSDPAYLGNRGLAPAVFRRAMELARRDHMRVAVHTVSAADFHLAVAEGANIIAHVPGYMSVERITPQDAAIAARNHIWVITTAMLARDYPAKGVDRDALRAAQVVNLQTLRRAGVRLAVGSDTWGDTSYREAAYLRSLGVFRDSELLQMWTQNCPKMIFPQRRIGRLHAGFEANFVVLEGNPLADFSAVQHIRLLVKNGETISKPTP
jgi:imidazolonepropionase-like amidohydrolase